MVVKSRFTTEPLQTSHATKAWCLYVWVPGIDALLGAQGAVDSRPLGAADVAGMMGWRAQKWMADNSKSFLDGEFTSTPYFRKPPYSSNGQFIIYYGLVNQYIGEY